MVEAGRWRLPGGQGLCRVALWGRGSLLRASPSVSRGQGAPLGPEGGPSCRLRPPGGPEASLRGS